MEQLEGEGIKESMIEKLKQFREWLKPNPADSLLIQSLKMIYKAAAVLVLIVFSPVILLIMLIVFFGVL
jgi:lipopolysaccharide/colanic/teichoic acid biosynthesis glycosyltransferase